MPSPFIPAQLDRDRSITEPIFQVDVNVDRNELIYTDSDGRRVRPCEDWTDPTVSAWIFERICESATRARANKYVQDHILAALDTLTSTYGVLLP